MLPLDVIIATHRLRGILAVERAIAPRPPAEGVRYIVSWQQHDNAPLPLNLARREDVTVLRTDCTGLSPNRNNAISHSTAPLLLIADDDITHTDDAIGRIRATFTDDPALALATFIVHHTPGGTYPDKAVDLRLPLPKGYSVTSFEIAYRRQALPDLRFHPGLGLGSGYAEAGEEELFLLAAIKRGVCCRFYPIVIGSHPDTPTTGHLDNPPISVIRAQGCIVRLYYPASWPLRLLLKAYRLTRCNHARPLATLKGLWQGARYAHTILNSPSSSSYTWHEP